MVTVVTATDQEKMGKLFNPQNTNEKPAEYSKAVFTLQKNTDSHFMQFQNNEAHDPKLPSNTYKIKDMSFQVYCLLGIFFPLQNTALTLLLPLL